MLMASGSSATEELTEALEMRSLLDSILVIGHSNPDTDAATSAATYAYFLNKIGRYERPVVPAVLGALTPQTKFVFEQAGIAPPMLVDNIEPRVGHAINPDVITLTSDHRLGEAFEKIVRHDVSVLPIIDHDGKLVGCFSNRSDASRFLMGFDPSHLWGSLLNVDDLVTMPGMSLVSGNLPESQSTGELIVALDGDRNWSDIVSQEDVLICGSLSAIDDIPEARLPHCIVLVSTADQRGTNGLTRIKQTHTCLYQYHQNITSLLATLTLRIRLGALALPTGMCVGELDRLKDVEALFRNNHYALPVIDQDDTLLGVIGRADIRNCGRTQAILVDHFEKPQAVKGIDTAEVLEILDHHRVGDLQTSSPLLVQCRPVGSSCTIVATNFFQNKIEPPKGIATLLLGGIVADTLVLTGPTTTNEDREVASKLAEIAEVDLQTFGRQVLIAADDLLTADPKEIWHRDRKEFTIRDRSVSIAQLETASLVGIPKEKLVEFQELVQRDLTANGRLISLLVLTDVLESNSWIFAAEASDVEGTVRETFSVSGVEAQSPEWIAAPGVVSRKKQIVPRLMTALASA